MTSAILVYQDYIHNGQILFNALARHYGADNVSFCDAHDILNRGLNSDAQLFVMPGGADLYFCEKLDGPGNAAIRRWVEAGGVYLGICAGAYYACRAIDWAKDTDQAIAGSRELSFFPGKATGPVHEFIEDGAIGKSWLAAARLFWDDGENHLIAAVCYEGGPVFEEGHGTVLARYADLPGQPPAIIECAAGLGRAILCGPHIEQTPAGLRKSLYRHRNSSYEWESAVIEKLERDAENTAAIRQWLFDRALLNRE